VRTLLLATRNEGKLREMRHLLRHLDVRLESVASHPEVGDIEETGSTFEENARIKAIGSARASGLWAIAEDSGIGVDALGGAPGVRSARYAGVHGDDDANNRKLLAALAGERDRAARYACCIALANPEGEVLATATGTCEGRIAKEPRGKGGFGYDPLFEPERAPGRTMAELTPVEKSSISHRGQAVRAFVPLLRALLEQAADEVRRGGEPS
jgi:XTP/dITP diphosphohydrolase